MEGDLNPYVTRTTVPNFNPLPPHGGRLVAEAFLDNSENISIHSLRMEGDVTLFYFYLCTSHFNPLPPHGGRLYIL